MYEIATIVSLLIIILLCVILVGTNKRIDTLVENQGQFYVAYAEYVTAMSSYVTATSEAMEELSDKDLKGFYATTSLAAHVEYLEKRIEALEGGCNAL